ncbi:MAG TPA: hypothetical protein V6C88_06090 [Chroococcidiopsis sp.]
MSQLDLHHCVKQVTNPLLGGLALDYQVYHFSPNHPIKIVVISNSYLLSDRFMPLRMVHTANQIVQTHQLDPANIVWIERFSSSYPAAASFHLLHFDWLSGQATSPSRSPITEEWYLSWLENKLFSGELKQTHESVLTA